MNFQEYAMRRRNDSQRQLLKSVRDFMGNLFGTVKENDLFILYKERVELLRDLRALLKNTAS